MEILVDILDNGKLSPSELDAIRHIFALLIMLPIVSTLTGIVRHVVGLKSLSTYAPIVLTFSFYEMGYSDNALRGLKFGIPIYFIVIAVSLLVYKLLKQLRMHYVPKSNLILINVSLSIILAIFLGTLVFEKKGLVYLDIFSLIMITSLSETVTSVLARKNTKTAIYISLQTLATALISYFIISLNDVETFVLTYSIPLILALLIINYYVGRYVGLRLTEYWRFRSILLDANYDRKNSPDQKK